MAAWRGDLRPPRGRAVPPGVSRREQTGLYREGQAHSSSTAADKAPADCLRSPELACSPSTPPPPPPSLPHRRRRSLPSACRIGSTTRPAKHVSHALSCEGHWPKLRKGVCASPARCIPLQVRLPVAARPRGECVSSSPVPAALAWAAANALRCHPACCTVASFDSHSSSACWHGVDLSISWLALHDRFMPHAEPTHLPSCCSVPHLQAWTSACIPRLALHSTLRTFSHSPAPVPHDLPQPLTGQEPGHRLVWDRGAGAGPAQRRAGGS